MMLRAPWSCSGPSSASCLHVGDRHDEFAVDVEYGGVGAGRPIGARHVLDAYARCRGVVEQTVAHRVAAHDADQVDAVTEPGDVLGDVAGNTSRRHRAMTGIARLVGCASGAASLEVDIGAPDDDGAGLLGEHIPTAEDHALLAQVGQVHIDRRSAGSQRRGKRGGVDQRVASKQVDDLLFPIREHLTSVSELY